MASLGNKSMGDARRTLKTMVACQWVIELLKRFSDFQVGIGDDEMMAVEQPSFHQSTFQRIQAFSHVLHLLNNAHEFIIPVNQ